MASSESLVTVPLSRPSSSRRSVLDERHVDGALGADRPQRAEADAEVADPRGVALEHVEAGLGCLSRRMKSPLTGVDSSAPPGTRTWYDPRDGEKTP